jgi:hypothetical protein
VKKQNKETPSRDGNVDYTFGRFESLKWDSSGRSTNTATQGQQATEAPFVVYFSYENTKKKLCVTWEIVMKKYAQYNTEWDQLSKLGVR